MARVAALLALCAMPAVAAPPPLTVLALGDSLTAGLGVAKQDTYPAKLEAALQAEGYAVRLVNSGVSGDTSAGGRARLDWALGTDTDAAIVALGANDALRGLSPDSMYDNLAAILDTLAARQIPTLLIGMRAPPNMGEEYADEFVGVYRRLSQKYDVVYYPFLLDGIAANPDLNQDDGMHPTAAGYDELVKRVLPSVRALLARAGRPAPETPPK